MCQRKSYAQASSCFTMRLSVAAITVCPDILHGGQLHRRRMMFLHIQVAALRRTDRDAEVEAKVRLHERLQALGLPVSPESLDRALVPPPENAMDTAMLHLPRPGIARDFAKMLRRERGQHVRRGRSKSATRVKGSGRSRNSSATRGQHSATGARTASGSKNSKH